MLRTILRTTAISVLLAACSKEDSVLQATLKPHLVAIDSLDQKVPQDMLSYQYGADINKFKTEGRGAEDGPIVKQPHAILVGNSITTHARELYKFDQVFADMPYIDYGFGGALADALAFWQPYLTYSNTGQKAYYVGENHFTTRYVPGWYTKPTPRYDGAKLWIEFYLDNLEDSWKKDLAMNSAMHITLISEVVCPKLIADKDDIIGANAAALNILKSLTQNWSYIDIANKFVSNGEPNARYFQSDGIHWKEAAYTEVLYPALRADAIYKTLAGKPVLISVVKTPSQLRLSTQRPSCNCKTPSLARKTRPSIKKLFKG